jgi:CBS domain-containing protein
LFALANGIDAGSTLGRLAELREKQIWSRDLCNQVEDHFRQVIGLRLIPSLQWEDGSYLSNSYVKLSLLSRETISTIKSGMRLAIRLQKMTSQLPDIPERLPG